MDGGCCLIGPLSSHSNWKTPSVIFTERVIFQLEAAFLKNLIRKLNGSQNIR